MRGLKIFSLAFFSYLLLSLYANYFDETLREIIYSKGFEPSMVILGTLMALLFFLAFAFGYISGFELPVWFLIALLIGLSFYDPPVAPMLALLLIISYKIRLDPFRKFPDVALALSLLVPILLYLHYGVPIFAREVRYTLVGPLVLLALLAAVGMSYSRLSVRWKTVLLGAYTMIFFLGTFRSLVLLVYLSYFFSFYLSSPRRGRGIGALGILLFGVVLWMSGGLDALLVRVGFTFLVFHNLVRLSLPWGLFHGALLLSDNPRHMVSELFGASLNYTYFFFGQAVADFGFLGLLEAFLLGVLLKGSEKSPQTLALSLSVMIYSLDPGIDALTAIFLTTPLIFESLHGNE